MELYARQDLLKDLKVPETATVVGCGGTGFWTGLFLAMSGVENLILIDPDIVEESNLNRLPITKTSIGQDKTYSLETMIFSLRRGVRIESHKISINNEEDCTILRGSVFCCTDSLKSQQLILAYCRKNKLPYQRIGYDGTILNVSRSFPMTFKDEVPDGYTVTPSWVAPAAMAAAMGVSSQLFKEITIMDDISTLANATLSAIPCRLREKIADGVEEDLKDNGWGDCDNCDERKGDDHGYCPDCNRNDCDNCDYHSPDDVHDNYVDKDKYEKMEEKLNNEINDLQDDINSLTDKIEELEKKNKALIGQRELFEKMEVENV